MKKFSVITAYVLVFWILLPALLIVLSQRLESLLDYEKQPLPVTGGIILGVSVIILVTAIVQYYKFTGSLPVSAYPPQRIIRTGLYNYWRHPVYLFYTASFTGFALAYGSMALLYVIIPAFMLLTFIYILIEEKQLIKRFGDAYKLYKSQTGLIIPVFYQVMRYPVLALLRFLFDFRYKNHELIPAPPYFIVAEHKNYLDPFFIAAAIPYPVTFPATYEVFRSPPVKWFMHWLFSIPRKRFKPDYSSVKQLIGITRKGGVLGLFPEGERSWTGETQHFKSEVMRLLCKMNQIPVLPVKIDGDYYAWPRWAEGFRRYRVTVTLREPFYPEPDCSPEELEQKIMEILGPSGTPQKSTGMNYDLAQGLEKVLYRCPGCRKFNSFWPAGNSLVCRECGLRIEVFPDLSVQFYQDGILKRCSIGEFYDTVRVTPGDPVLGGKLRESGSDKDQDAYVPDLQESGECLLSLETPEQFRPLFKGVLALSETGILFKDSRNEISCRYQDISSVTTERNDKLQIYDYASNRLYQAEFMKGSVLQWQDVLSSVIFMKTGRLINTR